jgi:tetratricopeptide (TPR) repeat protein
LASKSLLRALPAGRYEMHELLRQFASERLAALPEAETAARDKHCAHYTAFLQQREDALFGTDAARAQAEIRAEIDNIRAAWDWAVEQVRVEEIARGLNGLSRYYLLVGPLQEGEKLIGQAVERVRAIAHPDSQVLLSRLLSEQSRFQGVCGRCDQAVATAQEAIEVAGRVNALDARATGALMKGVALYAKSDYQAAQVQVEQCLALTEQTGLPHIRAEALRALARIHIRLGNFSDARNCFAQARQIFHALGNLRDESTCLFNTGVVQIHEGDYVGGRECLERALAILRTIGDRRNEGIALDSLGLVRDWQGDYVLARTHFQTALHIAREFGDSDGEATATINLGYVVNQMGDYENAREYFQQSLRAFTENGDRRGVSLARSCLGLLAHHQGDDATACQYCRQAAQIAQEVGVRDVQAYALTRLGHALTGLASWADAADAYQQALDIRRALGQQTLAMESIAGLARVALAQNNLSGAQTHVEEILTHLKTHNLDGTDEPFRIYLTCYRVLRANRDARAKTILNTAHRLLQERAARIGDEAARRSFLENVPHHREIVREFQARAQRAESL